MKNICLYFQIHQPFRYRRYRFFDIGNDHYYYDDYANETILRKIADNCYLQANKILLDAITASDGKFKVAFSLSGIAIEQFELYAPEVLDSFKELAATGSVEFLSETYSHSLVSLKNKTLFERQIKRHDNLIEKHFGQRPKVFRNTELIYSDEIGNMVAELGFETMLTEGAKHVLGWKSPNYLYCNAINPRLKVLMRNFKLSDDISFKFSNHDWSEFPLTADKFVGWLTSMDKKEDVVNIFMDYETFGEHQKKDTGIFDFLKAVPAHALKAGLSFVTPSEAAEQLQPVSAVHVPQPISWADEERDLSAWLGNDLQEEAFNKLYSYCDQIEKCGNAELQKDWDYLQVSDHFYYMCTKFFSDGEVHSYFNPYASPYEAFINYMNVLSDFKMRLDTDVPENEMEQQILLLKMRLEEKDELIKKMELEKKNSTAKVNSKPKKTSTVKKKTTKTATKTKSAKK